MSLTRRDKENYYLDIAETVSERGTCLRRNFGAIIVNHDEVISSGYNGAPRGRKNCIDLGRCIRVWPRAESDTRSVALYTRRPMPSSVPHAMT